MIKILKVKKVFQSNKHVVTFKDKAI